VVVTNSSFSCWINDPTGYLCRTRTLENKHEDGGGVNWKLLPARISFKVLGKKPHVYQVIYEVDEQRQTVWVLTIRHGARGKIQTSDLA
jgi:hypothetical protein